MFLGKATMVRRARKEFLWADVNGDGRVGLAEYLAEMLPDSFVGNETAAEIENSAVWSDQDNLWILKSKARSTHRVIECTGSPHL